MATRHERLRQDLYGSDDEEPFELTEEEQREEDELAAMVLTPEEEHEAWLDRVWGTEEGIVFFPPASTTTENKQPQREKAKKGP